MPRRRITLDLSPVVASLATLPPGGSADDRILDAAAELMRDFGLTRWSVDDVADRAGIGRTSVYRAFPARDDLVHGVLARELRETIAAIHAVAGDQPTLLDGIVEGAVAGVVALRGSVVDQLLRRDPALVLPLLTTDAAPLLAIARTLLAAQAHTAGVVLDDQQVAELAEVAARMGLSFILTRDTVFPVDDPDALRESLRRLLGPILQPLLSTDRDSM